MKTINIGSRKSRLAIIQTELVKDYIESRHPEVSVEIETMLTTGDRILDRTLEQIGGKGLFVKELDRALLSKKTELSVHSLKDMPMEIPDELPIIAYSKREDPRDVMVLPKNSQVRNEKLPIGCASRRRVIQLQKLFPDAIFKPIRGNLQTRMEKLERGEYGALVLAAAGLKRLGLEDRIYRYFEPDEVIPAAGQGILAVQGRQDVDYSYLQGYEDEEAAIAAKCERAFVKQLNGGCTAPIAAYAMIIDQQIHLSGLYYDESVKKLYTGEMTGDISEPEALGIRLAEQIGKTDGNKK